ncbi:hypothetical protein TNCV_409561 [Trichonephila clavipes]|nr:hypothetical protein TNCV_409561 [Trichonephila clavipes]
MDELILDQAPQDINKEVFQLERKCLQAFVAATEPGCIFDVKDAPQKGKPVAENVDKITEIIEFDRLVSSRRIARS